MFAQFYYHVHARSTKCLNRDVRCKDRSGSYGAPTPTDSSEWEGEEKFMPRYPFLSFFSAKIYI